MVWDSLTGWLLENGGPAVRYRTAMELLDNPNALDLDRLANDLLEDSVVKSWLERLKHTTKIHDSGNDRFENVVGKLLELGIRAGMGPFDTGMFPFRQRLERAESEGMDMLRKVILASGLARAGYEEDEPLGVLLHGRLKDLYRSTRKGTYNIYLDADSYPELPQNYQGRHGVVKPEFVEGDFLLPYIHDIYALSHFPSNLNNDGSKDKIGTVLNYILHPKYQALPHGYGYIKSKQNGKNKYYVLGWKADLPGYHGFDNEIDGVEYLVQRLELMAHFPVARKHRWFRDCLKHLESYCTGEGTYAFPRSYLKEQRIGYWVRGAHMGLEENRRSRRALEIESTFRMLKIKRLIEEGNGKG